MKSMKKMLLGAAALAVAMVAGGAAQAATHTASFSGPFQAVPFTDSFTLPGAYDPGIGYVPADGTLVSVDLTISVSAEAEVDIFNATGVPQAFTAATASLPVTLTGPGGFNVVTTVSAVVPSGVAAPGFNSYAGVLGTNSNTSNDPNLANYAVASPVSLNATGAGGFYSGSSVPGVFFSGSANAQGSYSVLYTYRVADVPLPAALPAGLALLGGLVVMSRKRRQA